MAAPGIAKVGCDAHSIRGGSQRGFSFIVPRDGQLLLQGSRDRIGHRLGDECRGRSLQGDGWGRALILAQPRASQPISAERSETLPIGNSMSAIQELLELGAVS